MKRYILIMLEIKEEPETKYIDYGLKKLISEQLQKFWFNDYLISWYIDDKFNEKDLPEYLRR